jgi:hypothetical protein
MFLNKIHFEICLPQWDQAKVDFHIDDLAIFTSNCTKNKVDSFYINYGILTQKTTSI